MLLAVTLDISARSMFRETQVLMILKECRPPAHLMFQWGQCFNTVKVWGCSGNVARWHTWYFSEDNALTQSNLRFLREYRSPAHLMFQWGQCFDTVKVWGCSGNVARWHTWCFSEVNALKQSNLRFLREYRSPAHLMFQRGQCFHTVNVEVPQRMLLASTLDVSVRLMLSYSQSLRLLRECLSPAHLMFQWSQYFDTVKVWGSSGNVPCRHTWCFK